MLELIKSLLVGGHLHPDQSVETEAANAKRFMVLSINNLFINEHWIEGFSEDIEGALALVLGIDPEWELKGLYDLRAALMGLPHEVEVQMGSRAFVDGVMIGEAWETARTEMSHDGS